MSEIENFIRRFRSNGTIETFTSGCCYWFAYILCGRFINSKIMYDIVANHFVAEINNRLFDITGDVTGKYNVISWDSYDDDLHKKRIIRCCVDFTEDKE